MFLNLKPSIHYYFSYNLVLCFNKTKYALVLGTSIKLTKRKYYVLSGQRHLK